MLEKYIFETLYRKRVEWEKLKCLQFFPFKFGKPKVNLYPLI